MNRLALAALAAWVCAPGPATGEGAFDPLTVAAIRGDADGVEERLDAGADPNARSWLGLTPLAAAMRSCRMNADVLELLIDAGADIEARSGAGTTPLMVAWQSGRQDLAQVLLGAGADPEARNIYGDTAAEYREYFFGNGSASAPAALRYEPYGYMTNSNGFVGSDCR